MIMSTFIGPLITRRSVSRRCSLSYLVVAFQEVWILFSRLKLCRQFSQGIGVDCSLAHYLF